MALVIGLTLLTAGCGGSAAPPSPRPTPTPPPKPNIIFIVCDDLDFASVDFMPRLRSLLGGQGLTLDNAFVSFPLCCPSRVSILRGQYAHNHRNLGNGPPSGGFGLFRASGQESSTVATWLKEAGYRTVLLGKYLNNYPEGDDTYVPPGWDEWYGVLEDRPGGNFDYFINENGRVVTYGHQPEDYQTDVLGRKTVEFIQRGEANDSQPFFIYVAPVSPHYPAEPAPRHEEEFPGVLAPRTPSFNEADVSDKPRWLRRQPLLEERQIKKIDDVYRRRLQSLLAVDEMIDQIFQALERYGELDNTYVFFTSDNGIIQGQHRFPDGKNAAYEESIRVPLFVRGPGTPAGRNLEHLAVNIDFAPTFAELAGVRSPDWVDGTSLVPLLGPAAPPLDGWRGDFLLEHWETGAPFPIPEYHGVRAQDHVYVEYDGPEIEFYDLRIDPDQLRSLPPSADPDLLFRLADRLAVLRNCAGAACRNH